MKPRICMCCGEPMAEGANSKSRNPNVCASCSSLADGMGEGPESTPELPPVESIRWTEDEFIGTVGYARAAV
jgi:hypothetical protein